jgi:hypothetical protein
MRHMIEDYERYLLKDYERRNEKSILAAGNRLCYALSSKDHTAERRGSGNLRDESPKGLVERGTMGL